ncbi:MAG: hypothetical protein U9Q99_01865 [Nanoarchaeota archaeon]|nr:hypothetical protein [Nanoarchaeota archaeon]
MVKNKKAVSPVIGYVLLITFGILMSVIAYNYLKTYVPREGLKCPDGVSAFITDYSCDSDTLNITLKNNGKFNFGGYFIYGSNDTEIEIATIMLAPRYLNNSYNPISYNISNNMLISGQKNYLTPQSRITHSFNITGLNLKLIELVPNRNQNINNKGRLVSCGEAKIREELTCS